MVRELRASTLVLAVGAVLGLTAGGAQAATIAVGCDVSALRAAVTTANGTTAADTLELASGCTYTLSSSVVTSTGGNGLPIVVAPLTVNGNGAKIVRDATTGVPAFRLLFVYNTRVALNNLTLTGGVLSGASQSGGGIVLYEAAAGTTSLALDHVTVSGNYVTGTNSTGGGIATAGGTLTATDSTFASNFGSTGGAGLSIAATPTTVTRTAFTSNFTNGNGGAIAANVSPLQVDHGSFNTNVANQGGAILTLGSTLAIDDSSFVQNAANNAGGIYTTQTGATVRRSAFVLNQGVVSTGAAIVAGGTANFADDTFASNVAGNSIGGLAVLNSAAVPGVANVTSSTFADSGKTAATSGGALPPEPGSALWAGASAGGSGAIHVTDTIVTDTDSTAPAPAGYYKQCDTSFGGGTITDDAGNLEWPQATCGFATRANPLFGAFSAVNLAYTPKPGSPAIDLGGASCPPTDQNGRARPDGDGCDAGAVETPAPETTVNPAGSPTNAPGVTFSADEASTFQCKVDSGAYSPCTSPLTPTLADGEHTVLVRATNTAGYPDPSPGTTTFVVDRTTPAVTITTAPDALTSDATATVAFGVDDPGATVSCTVDAGGPSACGSPFTTDALGDGEHSVTVRATDTAGNHGEATATFTVDTTAPATTITGGPGGPTGSGAASFTFTSADPGATFACRLDDGAFAACESPATYTGYAVGSHSFQVRATDAAGNVEAPAAERTFSYSPDVTAPVVHITSAPASPTADATPTIAFTVDDGEAAVRCVVDSGAPQACGSPFTTAALADGSHTVKVTATDAASNAGSDSATFVVDTTAPDTTITGGPTGTVYSAGSTFTFTASQPGSAFECRVDSAAFAPCSSPKSVTVAPGAHTFQVRAKDALGNTDATPAARAFTYQKCTLLQLTLTLLGPPVTICI
jgi:hypothetical protein